MKCSVCNSEWLTTTGLGASVIECPFCHSSLDRNGTQEHLTIEGVLSAIIYTSGIQTFNDGARTISLFADYAPNLIKERRLLKLLFESHGAEKILSSVNITEDAFTSVFNSVVDCLKSEYYISTEAAEMICASFVSAIDPNRPHSQKALNQDTIHNTSALEPDISISRVFSGETEERIASIIGVFRANAKETGFSFPICFYCDSSFPRKLRNAQKSYFMYKLENDESAIMLCDISAFNNGRGGFVLTSKRLFEGNRLSRLCINIGEIISFTNENSSVMLKYFKDDGENDKRLCTLSSPKEAMIVCLTMNSILEMFQ